MSPEADMFQNGSGDIERGKNGTHRRGNQDFEIKGGRYLVSDGRGLSLDVLPSGKMSWLYRYRLNALYEKVTLGDIRTLPVRLSGKRDDLAVQLEMASHRRKK